MSPLRVDFYLLTDPLETRYWTVVCRLINKAYQQAHQVLVYCEQAAQCVHLDHELWGYAEDTFIPHACITDPLATVVPVCIALSNTPLPPQVNLLVNLSTTLVIPSAQLTRLIEVIPAQEQEKAAARERFRYYRREGFTLQTHTIN